MNSLLLTTVLVSASTTVPAGSLIVLEHSNKAVATFTASPATHIAVVIERAGQPWVYEATPAKVRQLSLASYLAEIAALNSVQSRPTRVLLYKPQRVYSDAEQHRMRRYAESQVGRRYSIRGYVRDQQGDGVHCAEFTATVLTHSGRFHFAENPYAITPGELRDMVRGDYSVPVVLQLPTPQPAESWCHRAWKSCLDYSSWCSWACYETWTFCW